MRALRRTMKKADRQRFNARFRRRQARRRTPKAWLQNGVHNPYLYKNSFTHHVFLNSVGSASTGLYLWLDTTDFPRHTIRAPSERMALALGVVGATSRLQRCSPKASAVL